MRGHRDVRQTNPQSLGEAYNQTWFILHSFNLRFLQSGVCCYCPKTLKCFSCFIFNVDGFKFKLILTTYLYDLGLEKLRLQEISNKFRNSAINVYPVHCCPMYATGSLASASGPTHAQDTRQASSLLMHNFRHISAVA